MFAASYNESLYKYERFHLVGARKFLASSHSVRKSYSKLDSEGCVILVGMTRSSLGKRSGCGDEYIARDVGVTY
jgi:hypothetical protein